MKRWPHAPQEEALARSNGLTWLGIACERQTNPRILETTPVDLHSCYSKYLAALISGGQRCIDLQRDQEKKINDQMLSAFRVSFCAASNFIVTLF